MSRVREYCRENVLEKASKVFWGKGFGSVSMKDLVKATKLNTASMYKEFGSKEGLYEAVLDDIYERRITEFLRYMKDDPGMESLKEYLLYAQQQACLPNYEGCIFMNNLAEKSAANKGIIKRVEKLCHHLEGLFEGCIRAAQREGRISGEKNPKLLAHSILCFIQGLGIYGRVKEHKQYIPSVVDNLITTLEG